MKPTVIFIMGTGALSKAIVDTLSFSHLADITFYICSRSLSSSSWLATIGNARSSLRQNNLLFVAKEIDWDNPSLLTENLTLYQPAFVIHAASLQSFWSLKQDNKWSKLIRETGYGITMPLQCKLTIALAKAISNTPDPPQLINCCYPDAVNYVVKKCGLDVLCGIGNIGIIERLLSIDNNLRGELMLLANHFHIAELSKPVQFRTQLPKLWFNKKELNDLRSVFDKIYINNDASLNSITSLTCLRLLSVLLDGSREEMLHLPAPHGQIGGYPVFFKNKRIDYIGTKILDGETERKWNKNIMEKEGLLFSEDRIGFSEKAFEKINRYSQHLARGFSFSDIEDYITDFIDLKKRLSL